MTYPRTIAWDQIKLAALKKGYEESTGDFSIEVKPEGRLDLVRGYAKYLIEFLESQIQYLPAQPYNEGEEGQ